jgi:hypothetical protein
MSSRPSAFMSVSATSEGGTPTFSSVRPSTPPAPLPNTSRTLLAPWFATTRSGLPSLFMSPIAIELGASPDGSATRGSSAPVPSFSSAEIDDVLVTRDAFQVSSLPELSEKRRMSTALELSGVFVMR